MKEIESFSIEDNKKPIKDEKSDLIKRFEVHDYNLKEPLVLKNKKKNKFPLLFYVLIFASLLLLCLIISFIVEYVKKKKNYTLNEDPFLKPNISNHNYTDVKFDNGLELLLIQVDENDVAGGSIIFDTGYLDTNYKPGFLKLAFLSLLTDDIQKNIKLLDYLGEFNYEVKEHYSYFNFKIVNAGFFSYLEIFSKLTYLDSNDNRYSEIKSKTNKLTIDTKNLIKKEKHLLEYLIYGYKSHTENEEDIYPEGNNIKDLNESDIEEIKNIMKNLLNPTKMKIVLNSHFKMSLMKNKYIKYFQNIIHKKNEEIDKNPAYNISDFITNKMIYMQIENYQTNYIKINYYINGNNNYEDLIINSGYFNYLKYILDETNPESLYYILTNSDNYNIKSLSCDFEVILKSKIKFSINIDLNYYSYQNLQDIIKIVYEYMDKLVDNIKSSDGKDERTLELFTIMGQTFSFTEDLHDISGNNPTKGINLFSKNKRPYFLRDKWIPGDYNISQLKDFVSQLTSKNSVLIVGINNYTYNVHKEEFNKSILNEMFKNNSYNDIYGIYYKIDDLDKILERKNLIINNNINFTYYPNKYISKYNGSSKLDYNKKDIYNYLDLKSDEIENIYNLRVFYFKRDTSFKIPKVYITLNFYHPYMRPQGEKDFNNERFFELMLYMAYIKREINLQLADAIRAGNSFSINFNQNLFYIDIFAYSDIANNILDIIRDITMNQSEFILTDQKTFFYKYFEIYRDAVLEDFLNFENESENFKMRMTFYENLFNEGKDVGIYNYLNFPTTEFKNKRIDNDEYMQFITISAINGHIFGYLELDQAKNISNAFNISNKNDYNKTFVDLLDKVNIKKINVTSENFTKWMNNKNNLETNKTLNFDCTNKNIKIYRFFHWSKYDLENRATSYIFNKLLKEGLKGSPHLSDSIVFSQKEIYLQFNIISKEDDKDDNKFIKYLENIYTDEKLKSEYEKKIDVVGNRLYYLIRNYLADLHSYHEDMKNSAIGRINSNTNNQENYKDLEKIKDMNYIDFLNDFKKLYKKQFHIDFVCENESS